MSIADTLPSGGDAHLRGRRAVLVFAAFALAYFLSTLLRAITATLSPMLTQEFDLDAGSLGLLAGGYFLGFALTQLPMGRWLDRYGPRRVELSFLVVAVLGCLLFSVARSFEMLLLARMLTGVGVSACLMAALVAYRRWYSPAHQLRTNSWMLMVGSSGVVAASLPVQWLLPLTGWRPLFWMLAGGVLLSMVVLAWALPAWHAAGHAAAKDAGPGAPGGYAQVMRAPFFRSVVPVGFFLNGGLTAMQTLWVVPWLRNVAGYSAAEAAQGMFVVSLAVLASYWAWGLVNPWLARHGWPATRVLATWLPLSLLALGALVLAGPAAGTWMWVLYCSTATTVSLIPPASALAMPVALAGRTLSAYNLVVFVGIFCVQWGVGLLIDLWLALGWSRLMAYQLSFGVFWLLCLAAYLFFLWARPYHRPASATTA